MEYGSKRYTDDDGAGTGAPKRARTEIEAPAPSKVLHIRGIPDTATEHDLRITLQPYGAPVHVVMMSRQHQALVEMNSIEEAQNILNAVQQASVFIAGRPVFFNYSKSQELKRNAGSGAGSQDANPTNVILITVHNVLYPITVEVIHSICSPIGRVQRIVIFRKQNVQALVEFDNPLVAQQAKASLDGAEIYAGCCSLKVESSHTTTLNVRQQTLESWDYTLPETTPLLQQAPLQPPPASLGQPRMAPASGSAPYAGSPHAQFTGYPAVPGQPAYPQEPYYGMSSSLYSGGGGSRAPPLQQPHQMLPLHAGGAAVVMVYNMSEQMNCERVFNLFCPYGNVNRIKFLVPKTGTCMVEVADALVAQVVQENLSGITVLGSRLDMQPSRHQQISGRPPPGQTLYDGSPVMVEYQTSPLNRFNTAKSVTKNRVTRPTKVLHFFNGPPALTEADVRQHLSNHGCHQNLVMAKIFEKEGTRGSSGLLEFASLEEAVDVLVLLNHVNCTSSSGDTSMLKLAFSLQPSISSAARSTH